MICKYFLLLAYSFGGALLTYFFIECLVKNCIRKKSNRPKDFLSELKMVVFFSGYLEVILYGGSFLIGKPEFIILWIGVKTALRWDRKHTKQEELSDKERRGIYHSFLMGTALNIIFGFVSSCLITGDCLTFVK